MKVCARPIDSLAIPAAVEPYTRQAFVTAGKEYDVHAVVVFGGVLFFLLVNDLDFPSFSPSLLFCITDPCLQPDWMFNIVRSEGGGDLLLVGPDFIVRDEASYNGMVGLDADQVDRFWKRVSSREKLAGRSTGDTTRY